MMLYLGRVVRHFTQMPTTPQVNTAINVYVFESTCIRNVCSKLLPCIIPCIIKVDFVVRDKRDTMPTCQLPD